MRWIGLVKPGDWLAIVIATVFCMLSFRWAWQAGIPQKALVRQGGERFAELDLARNRRIDVPGPLGITTVVVEHGQVRVASDPGPRQYCVRQGWLTRPGEIAICAPNQVSVEVLGSQRTYDSLAY